MSKLVQSYTSWQPLEEVIVGTVYTPEYFSHIKEPTVRSQLSQILEETIEDLDNLQHVIEQYGAIVRRPDLPTHEHWAKIIKYWDQPPVPPLTPRDWQITLGEKLLQVINVGSMNTISSIYEQSDPGCVINPHRLHKLQYDSDHPLNGANASCIVRVGTDVFFDNSEWMTEQHMNWIQDNVLDSRFKVRRAQTNGHGDSVFAILKPGVIISSMHDADINYKESFPGWEVCKVWDSTIWAAQKVGEFKAEHFNERWYVPGVEPTSKFANYVDTYLNKWTGFVKETVFDVNCLVLDEQHVIFSSYNKDVFDFCRRHKIEPIISPLRHKYFYDGGISCCTQDIRRRGSLETYL
jgi:glycine amidinotransferase/scyllo-inosamine-4-phosphate amidinotransferase 1